MRPSPISVCFESSCMRFSWLSRGKEMGEKGDTWCTAWFLSDGGKRRDAALLQETNRPASARLYIFRHSSQPSLSTSLVPSRSHPAAAQPLLATLFFYRYPGCRYFKGDVPATRMRPLVYRKLCEISWTDIDDGRCDRKGIANARIRVNYKMSSVWISPRDDFVKKRLWHSRYSDVIALFRVMHNRSRLSYVINKNIFYNWQVVSSKIIFFLIIIRICKEIKMHICVRGHILRNNNFIYFHEKCLEIYNFYSWHSFLYIIIQRFIYYF